VAILGAIAAALLVREHEIEREPLEVEYVPEPAPA
jgi:hypothetical protein